MRPLSLPSQGPPRLPLRPSLSPRASSPQTAPVPEEDETEVEVDHDDEEDGSRAASTTMRLLSPPGRKPPALDGAEGPPEGQQREETEGAVLAADADAESGGTGADVKTPAAPLLPKRPALLTDLALQDTPEDRFANLSEFFFMNPVAENANNISTGKSMAETPPRQLQPLNLTLPSITSVANKSLYGTGNANGSANGNANGNVIGNINTSGKGNSARKNGNGNENNINNNNNNGSNNKFYIRLLEDVHLDDQTVLFDLVDTLMQVRSQNERLKEGLWTGIDSLSTATNKSALASGSHKEDDSARYDHNSLMYDSKLTNDELAKMLAEQRSYNRVLAQTVDEFQDSLDSILNSLVASNSDAGTELISSINAEEAVVEKCSDEMWQSWMEVVSAMEDVAKFDSSIVNTIHGL